MSSQQGGRDHSEYYFPHYYPQDQYLQYPPPPTPIASYPPHLQQPDDRSRPVTEPDRLSSYQNPYWDAYLEYTNSSATPNDNLFTSGVYAYDGGSGNAYGDRGNLPASSSSSSCSSGYEDYGRVMGFEGEQRSNEGGKIVRAIPKEEEKLDCSNVGMHKFRVKLLTEGYEHADSDVLLQVGLDSIHVIDPSTSTILRIYPLETVEKCEVLSSSIFAFWTTSTDSEPRRITIEASNYVINLILDTVTAAIFQFEEMGMKDGTDRSEVFYSTKPSQQQSEKKKDHLDLMSWIRPIDEEKHHWVPDDGVSNCTSCKTTFGTFVRKHHCRNCGGIFCDKCTNGRITLTSDEEAPCVRVCDRCMAEVLQRSSNTKESVCNLTAVQSHEKLAKKLQEEIEKNRNASKVQEAYGGSGKTLREVACPTCTVHLQVELPSYGSETIECGVCQHPFILNA